MTEFFDTSVLIAAFWGEHQNHEASVRLLGNAKKKQSFCGIHSLAEAYSTMTALPIRPRILPEQALLLVEEIRTRLTIITLEPDEYFETIQQAAARQLTSGRVYDALLLRCATKAHAQKIYTWNLKHFLSIAPELAGRIQTP